MEQSEFSRLQPDVTPQQADMLINNQLYPGSLAAYYVQLGEAGHIVVQQTEKDGVYGYRIEPQESVLTEGRDPLVALLLDDISKPQDLPQPAADAAWEAFDPETQELKYSPLFIMASYVRHSLAAQGYTRDPATTRSYTQFLKIGRWAWLPGGIVTTGLAGYETGSVALGASAGLIAAVVLQRGVVATYHWLESNSAAIVNEGRLLPRGTQTVTQLGELEHEMQQALDNSRPLSPAECRKLLPYAIVRSMHRDWLATPAAQQAYNTLPHWLKPVETSSTEQPKPTARLQAFIDFCMASAVQPGEIHMSSIPSAHLHRQAALGQIHDGLTDTGESIPETPK